MSEQKQLKNINMEYLHLGYDYFGHTLIPLVNLNGLKKISIIYRFNNTKKL